VALGSLAYASQGPSVLLASELAVQQAGPLVRPCRPGRQGHDRWSRQVVPDPEVDLAARPAPAAQPGWWLLPRSDQRRPRPPDRLEVQADFQAPGAAAAALAAQRPAAQAEQPGLLQVARSSFQARCARRWIAWALAAGAGPIRVRRRQRPGVHPESLGWAKMGYEVVPESQRSQLDHRPGVAVVPESQRSQLDHRPGVAVVADSAPAPAEVSGTAPASAAPPPASAAFAAFAAPLLASAGSTQDLGTRPDCRLRLVGARTPCSDRLGSQARGPGPWRRGRCWRGRSASGPESRCFRTDPADRV
jgi:hypothetical protein